MSISSVIIGLIMTIIGVILLAKTEWFVTNFGRIAWFEEKLGSSGGSRLGYKLVGIVFVFLGVIVMTGSGTAFITWVLNPLFKLSGSQQ
jgi:multisubunit Na+/H+ antiporter MnhB subunit